jgi:hypothetical protein
MQMADTRLADPQILHELPGRVRVRLAPWPWLDTPAIEQRLRRVEGVVAVTANQLTQTVLIRFDPALTSTEHVLTAARALYVPAIARCSSDISASSHRSAQLPVPIPLPTASTSAASPVASTPAAPAMPALPVLLVPVDDVMRWANETIAQSDTALATPPTLLPSTPASWMRWLLSVLHRLDSATFVLKALTVCAGLLCAATPLALLLSAVEILQLLLELHVRLVA